MTPKIFLTLSLTRKKIVFILLWKKVSTCPSKYTLLKAIIYFNVKYNPDCLNNEKKMQKKKAKKKKKKKPKKKKKKNSGTEVTHSIILKT